MFRKTLIFISITSIRLIHASEQALTPEQHASVLMRTAHSWLVGQSQQFTAAGYKAQTTKNLRSQDPVVTETCFSLSSSRDLPLVHLRICAYHYFTFTEHATPANLGDTPLSNLLIHLRTGFERASASEIRIAVSDKASFVCEYSEGYIHCIQREA